MRLLPVVLTGALLLAALPVAAQGLFDEVQTQQAGEQREFLPVDEAFRVRAEAIQEPASGVRVVWDIAEDYYLYRHALDFELVETEAGPLAHPRIPDGKPYHDEFFGDVETYHDTLSVVVPLKAAPAEPIEALLEVRYQGCAEAGICYPPQARRIPVLLGTTGALQAPTLAATPEAPAQDQLAGLIADANIVWTVLVFLGFGLLLSFTPCVLPMIPILSGIIVGEGEDTNARRGFILSTVYVLAMAAAYTLFGIVAALAGANLQAALQAPWIIVGFAAVFVLLALSMFGLYELRLPATLQSRLSTAGRGGTVAGSAVLGFVSALIVGPCIAPPLAGALLYIGQTGDAVLGGLALFAMGMGMGLPLIAMGALGGGALPKAGTWMVYIQRFFGLVLLGVAVWLLGRILPLTWGLLLWVALLIAGGAYLLSLRTPLRMGQIAGLTSILLGATLAWGLLEGDNAVTRYLDMDAGPDYFTIVDTREELKAELAIAHQGEQPALLDFWADWCIACKQLDRHVFADPGVQKALADVRMIKLDVTANSPADQALLEQYQVIGPPTVLFFDAQGNERSGWRLIGEVDSEEFLRHLQGALPEHN